MASQSNLHFMDPTLLDSDELKYELNLRMIPMSSPNHMTRLNNMLDAEIKGIVDVPKDTNRLTRQTVTLEYKECEQKLSQIENDVSEAIRKADEELIDKVQARVAHIAGRIVRLHDFAPQHAAVDRLVLRIGEASKNLNKSRESIGAGEQPEFQGFEEKDLVKPTRTSISYPEGLGSLPKKTAGKDSSGAIPKKQSIIKPPAANSIWSTSNPNHSVIDRNPWSEKMMETNTGIELLNLCGDNEWNHASASARNLFGDFAGHQTHHPPQRINVDPKSHLSGRTINTESALPLSFEAQPPPVQYPSRPGQGSHNQGGFAFVGGHRIHQWSLRFDGGDNGIDAEDFLFRVERQAQLYGVSERALSIGIGELLQGRVVQWYWNFQREYANATWDQLKEAFLRRFGLNQNTDFEIRARIEARKQKPGERFCEFCQDIESLALRLLHKMLTKELVEVLRRNMCLPLRRALWRVRTDTVDELISMCKEYEHLFMNEESRWQSAGPKGNRHVNELMQDTVQWNPYAQYRMSQPDHETPFLEAMQSGANRNEMMICWNCKDLGHTFTQCPRQRNHIFCFSCGMSGVLKAECPKCTGNSRRGAMQAGASRPSQQPHPHILRNPDPRDQRPPKPNPFQK